MSNEHRTKKVWPNYLAIFTLLVLAIPAHNLYFTGTISGNGFAETDLDLIEASIRENFEERGNAKVEKVTMIIKSAKEMIGFIEIKTTDGILVKKECSATIGTSRHIIWKCVDSSW